METHVEQLCQQLKEEVELKVVVASEDQHEKTEIINGIPVHRLRTTLNVLGALIWPALPKATRDLDADIIHVHTPHKIPEWLRVAVRKFRGTIVAKALRGYRLLLERHIVRSA